MEKHLKDLTKRMTVATSREAGEFRIFKFLPPNESHISLSYGSTKHHKETDFFAGLSFHGQNLSVCKYQTRWQFNTIKLINILPIPLQIKRLSSVPKIVKSHSYRSSVVVNEKAVLNQLT